MKALRELAAACAVVLVWAGVAALADAQLRERDREPPAAGRAA